MQSYIPPTVANAITGSIWGNTRLYTGREYDKETGLYYLRARHYDPNMGRFLQRDPIGTKDDVNLYRYVKNSPLNYTDRDGKIAKIALANMWNYFSYAGTSIVEGGVKGDFIQNPNGWNIVGQIGAGLIPLYGQGSDVRDVGAAWNNCSGGMDCATNMGLAGVGFIPLIGDGLKIAGKGAKYADEGTLLAEKLAKEEAVSRADEAVKIMGPGTNSSLSDYWGNVWNKYSFKHEGLNNNIEVHFMKNIETGEITQVKIK